MCFVVQISEFKAATVKMCVHSRIYNRSTKLKRARVYHYHQALINSMYILAESLKWCFYTSTHLCTQSRAWSERRAKTQLQSVWPHTRSLVPLCLLTTHDNNNNMYWNSRARVYLNLMRSFLEIVHKFTAKKRKNRIVRRRDDFSQISLVLGL